MYYKSNKKTVIICRKEGDGPQRRDERNVQTAGIKPGCLVFSGLQTRTRGHAN